MHAALAVATAGAAGPLDLGPEGFVQAGGADIVVPGYSVPSFADFNADGLKDLIVGEGGGGNLPKVRVYFNHGTPAAPQFGNPGVYIQAAGQDMTYDGPECGDCLLGGCLGLFPRYLQWNSDALKDLIVGQADGTVRLYTNVGTAAAPIFDAGALLVVGPEGSKETIRAEGGRATPAVVDWNNDGRKDLVLGGMSGYIEIFINEGTGDEPDFPTSFSQAGGANLFFPGGRASPDVDDLDADGKKDLLVGNTQGQLLLYLNTGSDGAPSFSGYSPVTSDGVPIDLPGSARSRPFVCDWTGDGLPDVLVGGGDGKIRLYQGIPEPTALILLAAAVPALLRKRRRITG